MTFIEYIHGDMNISEKADMVGFLKNIDPDDAITEEICRLALNTDYALKEPLETPESVNRFVRDLVVTRNSLVGEV